MNFRDFKYAIRHIIRYKEYSILNVIGLILGIASALLISLWIEHEVKTDKFHANGDNIYTVWVLFQFTDHGQVYNSITAPLTPAMEEEVPEITAATRLAYKNTVLFKDGDNMFYEEGHYADSNFFTVFTFPFVAGNSRTALVDPNSVVISKQLSVKLFGEANSIGKTLLIRDQSEELYTVTGVFEDIPSYSSLQFDYILPYAKYAEFMQPYLSWGNFNIRTFVLAQPDVDQETLNSKINASYQCPFEGLEPEMFVQPFEETYLSSYYKGSKDNPTGILLYVKIFILTALFIIFLACMNYTNLATALATKRGREVGVKKVFGSGRMNIMRQFTAEAIILVVLSFVLACILVYIVVPGFNSLIDADLVFQLNNTKLLIGALGILTLTILLAGTFPALYMSAFQPIRILKQAATPKKGIPILRQTLVVVQFVITIAFIISSLIIRKQSDYMLNTDLGLQKDNIVYFNQSYEIMNHREAFKNELLQQGGVLSVCYTNRLPSLVNNNTGDVEWDGKPVDYSVNIAHLACDADLCETMDIEIALGRDFDPAISTDTNTLLINETFANIMSMDNPVGEYIDYWGRREQVIGVVKDFHVNSLHDPIRPLMMMNSPNDSRLTLVRIDGERRIEAMNNLKRAFQSFDTSVPFDYKFLDVEDARNYNNEIKLSRISSMFTILTIVISCLGLFGLALFTAQQRVKEIGIRKSIGARTSHIMALIASGFIKWVLLSFVIASTASYFFMQHWLQSYAYHIDISFGVFLFTGVAILFIAFITVGWHVLKAATRNPVEALRYE